MAEDLAAQIVASARAAEAIHDRQREFKVIEVAKRTKWVMAEPGQQTASEKGKKGARGKDKKAEQTKAAKAMSKAVKIQKSDKLPDPKILRARADEMLAKPLSAWMLFGFSQRGALKKNASNKEMRAAVKAVGERWLLLSEAERAKYEAMAQEDQRRS